MYYSSSDRLDSVLESMFKNDANSESYDFSLEAALESFDNFTINTVGMSYVSEGVGASIKAGIKKVVEAIKGFFKKFADKVGNFFKGLKDKHVAVQNKINAAAEKIDTKLEKDDNLISAKKMVWEYSKKFNDVSTREYCQICRTSIDSVKKTVNALRDMLIGISEGRVMDVPEKSTVIKTIEDANNAIERGKDDIKEKKRKMEKSISEEVSNKFPKVRKSDIGAFITIAREYLEDISSLKTLVDGIESVTDENIKLAEKIEVNLTKPGDGASEDETSSYESLKKGVDLWKDVAKTFQKFSEHVLDGCNSAVSGWKIGNYVETMDGQTVRL